MIASQGSGQQLWDCPNIRHTRDHSSDMCQYYTWLMKLMGDAHVPACHVSSPASPGHVSGPKLMSPRQGPEQPSPALQQREYHKYFSVSRVYKYFLSTIEIFLCRPRVQVVLATKTYKLKCENDNLFGSFSACLHQTIKRQNNIFSPSPPLPSSPWRGDQLITWSTEMRVIMNLANR